MHNVLCVATQVRIGTSGYGFREWEGPFYPKGIRPEERLAFYASRLTAVELPAARHGLPSSQQLASWLAPVSEDFRLCLTAPRGAFRDVRPARAEAAIESLHGLVDALGIHAGPVLIPVAAEVHPSPSDLNNFLAAFRGLRIAVELADPEVRGDAWLRVLSAHGAGLVIDDDLVGMPHVELTSDFTYWRLKRVSSEAEWDAWSERAITLGRRGIEVFSFLKPDRSATAAMRAMAMQSRVDAALRGPVRPASEERLYH